MFQFGHVFSHRLCSISHPSYCLATLHAVNVLLPAVSFCGFQSVQQSHIKELSNVQDTGLPTSTGTGTRLCLALLCSFRCSKFYTRATDQLLEAEDPRERGILRQIFLRSHLYTRFSLSTFYISRFTQNIQHTNKD